VCEIPPAPHLLVVRNDDRPGMIGAVGTMLGVANVNIADMDVGRAATPGSAIMLVSTVEQPSAELLTTMRATPGIVSVHLLQA
jgi:D-3-phosphoglycerate dehydrogenase / 2-oxoglutarate reductase